MRTLKDGKLKVLGDGLVEHDENGILISGDVRDSWAASLFSGEYYTICDMPKVGLIFQLINRNSFSFRNG